MTWDGKNRRKDGNDLQNVFIAINNVNNHLESLSRKIDDDIKPLLKKHDETLYGNHSIGMATKIDRLEQSKKNHDKHAFAAWGAAIGLLIKSIWDGMIK